MAENFMLKRFQEFVTNNRLFAASDCLVIAVSGGADSVVLAQLCKMAGFRFVIAHVNFNLREKESERDELFVRGLATRLDVPVYVSNVNTSEYASLHNLSIQVAARNLRYDWFEKLRLEISQKTNGDKTPGQVWIATAHHLDDSVETMLMNLFRGTGITGLRGIMPKNDRVVRPLLCFTKKEIVAFAEETGLAWVEDSSNQLDKYTRNYFRNQLIPLLRNIYPQVDENLYQNLQRLNDAVVLYRESVDKKIAWLIEQKGSEIHIPILKLTRTPAFETILFEILQQYGFSSGQLPVVLNLLNGETGKQVDTDKYRLIKNRKWLIIAPSEQSEAAHVIIEEGDHVITFAQGSLTLEIVRRETIEFRQDKPGIPAAGDNSVALIDSRRISFPLLLRRWKQGDYFYPLGMKKKKKLARFLIDTKVSKTDKESVWVLEHDKKIVWVVGHRLDDRYRITDTTRDVLKISFLANK